MRALACSYQHSRRPARRGYSSRRGSRTCTMRRTAISRRTFHTLHPKGRARSHRPIASRSRCAHRRSPIEDRGLRSRGARTDRDSPTARRPLRARPPNTCRTRRGRPSRPRRILLSNVGIATGVPARIDAAYTSAASRIPLSHAARSSSLHGSSKHGLSTICRAPSSTRKRTLAPRWRTLAGATTAITFSGMPASSNARAAHRVVETHRPLRVGRVASCAARLPSIESVICTSSARRTSTARG